MNKKQTITVSILLLILFSLLGLYWSYSDKFSPRSSQGTILSRFKVDGAKVSLLNNQESITPELPDLVMLSSDIVVSATNTLDEEAVLYYEKGTGRTYMINLNDRKKTVVSDNILPKFTKSIWSATKKEAISVFSTPDGNSYRSYNFTTKKMTPLGKDILGAVFSPDGSKLALFKKQGDANAIILTDLDGSTPRDIFTTRLDNLKLNWPLANTLIFQIPNSEGGEDIFSLSPNRDLKRIIINDGKETLLNWAPGKNKFLFGQLSIWDNGLIYNTSLNVPSNFCGWSIDGHTLVCLKPSEINRGLSDLVKYDLITNFMTTLKKGLDVRLQEIFLSQLENYLVIIDTQNQLYAIKINI